jgi:hypothetical protein
MDQSVWRLDYGLGDQRPEVRFSAGTEVASSLQRPDASASHPTGPGNTATRRKADHSPLTNHDNKEWRWIIFRPCSRRDLSVAHGAHVALPLRETMLGDTIKARPHYSCSCSCSPGLCSSGDSSGFYLCS